MTRLFNPQTNFTAGLLDGLMLGRHDTKAFTNGARVLTNWVQLAQGGIRRRHGTNVTYEFGVATTDERIRLLPFVFSEDQHYVIAIRQSLILVFTDAGALVQSLTPPASFTAVDIRHHRWSQRGDVIILTGGDYPPQVITRTSATSFTLSNFAFDTQDDGHITIPMLNMEASSVTLTPDNDLLAGTLTASAAIFDPAHVGVHFKIEGNYRLISAYNSATSVDFTVPAWDTDVDGIGTTATANWQEEAYSAYRGYARAVAFHGQRLWLSGSDSAPAHVFSSKSLQFFNFDVGTALDNESVQGIVSGNQVNYINHLVSMDRLFILTDSRLFYQPETDEVPVTPGAFNPRIVSSHGSSRHTDPVLYEDTMLYVQSGEKAVRKVFSDEFTNRIKNDSVSLLTHDDFSTMGDSAVIDVFPSRPEQYGLFVMDSGSIAVYHAISTENLQGWSVWTPYEGYKFISVSATDDCLFVVIEGPFWSTTSASVENQQVLCRLEEAITLDCCYIATSVTAANVFTVPDRYLGLTVHLVADSPDGVENAFYLGSVAPTTATGAPASASIWGADVWGADVWGADIWSATAGVPGGTVVTLPNDLTATRLVVGLDYPATSTLLPAVYELPNGVQFTEPKRIVSATIEINDTFSMAVEGVELITRNAADIPENASTPVTGQKKIYNLGWDKRGQITVSVPQPLPATLLSVTREVAF